MLANKIAEDEIKNHKKQKNYENKENLNLKKISLCTLYSNIT